MAADIVARLATNREHEIPPAGGSWLAFSSLYDALAATRSKLAKRAAMAAYLRPLNAATAALAAQYLTGTVFAESDDRKVQVGSQ